MVSSIAVPLHILAAIVWVGGMFFAHMALRPSVAVLEPPQRLALWAGVFARFFAWVWLAVVLLLATGYAIIFIDYGGFAATPVSVHLMQALGLVMAALFVVLFFVPYRRFRSAMAAGDWLGAAAAQAVIRKIVASNLLLGLVTSAVAAGGRFWG